MPSSLIPEKPLLIYPSLASTLGLEQACMLAGLNDRVMSEQAQISGGFRWYQLNLKQLQQIFPFWQNRDLQRLITDLREKGVIVVNSPPLESCQRLQFAFNEQQVNTNQTTSSAQNPLSTHSIPVVNTQPREQGYTQEQQPHYAQAQRPQAQETPASGQISNQANTPRGEPHSHFLSKNIIAPNWRPDETTLSQLAQHNIQRDFALQQVPEFVTYWRERGERHHSWGSKFMQQCIRKWRDHESLRFRQEQQNPISHDWKPSLDAMEILVEKAAIKRAFVEDAIPEFILYWRERGESHTTWNTKFVQHVRIQWAKYTSAIEHNTDPRPMPANWQPSSDVFDVLRLANIDLNFAKSLIAEFVIYWRDRGQLCGSWNTKYLQHIKRMWAQRHDSATADTNANSRSTREIRLEEELTDRSWAN
ncbi:DnaT-like ssDNA-binding domain-containing protein [Agaribacterium sp. ZY112]|uniref:DnaT-like ssDNA-binding domain-containing protein n=1 Tax=Agaribacterium sp. ZY112 TaxID=3233574 RepID=UPI0035232D39